MDPSQLYLVLVLVGISTLGFWTFHDLTGISQDAIVKKKQEQNEALMNDELEALMAESLMAEAPFNPYADLLLTLNTTSDTEASSHRCVYQPFSNGPKYVGNTCIFRNLIYSRKSHTFHYYADPIEMATYGSKEELQQEISTSAGYILFRKHLQNGCDSSKRLNQVCNTKDLQLNPTIHWNETVPSNVASISTTNGKIPIFLLYKLSYSFNFGHFLFDDVLTLFTMLDFFGYSEIEKEDYRTYQHVPVFIDHPSADPYFRCHPKLRWDVCSKLLNRVMPKLVGVEKFLQTSNLFVGKDWTIPAGASEDMIRLPLVVAGPGRLANFACEGDCAIQRTGRMYRYRQWLFQNVFGSNRLGTMYANQTAQPGKVVVSLPIGNTHKDIETFETIIPRLKKQFGEENVTVVDMATLSIEEQVRLISTAKVYVTNQGGGSATSVFLPRGSTMLIFYVNAEDKYDESLYHSIGYFHLKWLAARRTSVEKVIAHVQQGLHTSIFR